MKQNTTYSSHPNRASRAAHERAKQQYPTYDTSLIQPRKKKSKGLIIFIIIVVCVLACVAGFAFVTFSGCSKTLAAGKTAEVTIEEGSSTWTIANEMSKAGVVENPSVFTATVTEMGAESSLKPGTYIFEGGKSVREYVEILCEGPDKYSPQLVVTEGMRLRDIALAVEKTTKSRITKDQFINATSDASVYAQDYEFLSEAGTNSLEGFLFPKTYSVTSKDSVDDIVKKMLDQYKKELDTVDTSYGNSRNLTNYEMLILASIVEKESATGMHRKVASVFYNRLSSGMYINSDATTAYELGRDPTAEEVHSNTPYSTYTNFGLPPTPICSPGKDAIEAVCNPENTNYLFFVFKTNDQGELEYKFSENFDDHQQAILDLGLV